MGFAERLQDKDTATGLAVGLALIVAMAGLFMYERGQFHAYELTWETREALSTSESGELATGGSADHTFPVTVDNVANALVALRWTDDTGDADTFRVELVDPDGATVASDEGSSGSLSLTHQVSAAPNADVAPGRNPDDAAEQAALQYATTEGQGTWTVIVTLVSAPGTTVPGAGVEAQADGTNTFDLVFTVEVHEPVIGPET